MGESASITRTTERGRAWSITLNNPTPFEISLWNDICSHATWVKEAKGQLEKGAEGTPHIQGFLRTDPVRFSQVKKLLPRAHIELARNAFALERYVSKEETREGELKGSKRDILLATPLTIQKHLYDSLYILVFSSYLLKSIDDKGNFAFRMLPRVKQPFKKNPTNFLRYLRNEPNWQFWITQKADNLLAFTQKDLIQKGYYSTEFIFANNLMRKAFKDNLYDIIIRHANAEEKRASEASGASEASLTLSQENI